MALELTQVLIKIYLCLGHILLPARYLGVCNGGCRVQAGLGLAPCSTLLLCFEVPACSAALCCLVFRASAGSWCSAACARLDHPYVLCQEFPEL